MGPMGRGGALVAGARWEEGAAEPGAALDPLVGGGGRWPELGAPAGCRAAVVDREKFISGGAMP